MQPTSSPQAWLRSGDFVSWPEAEASAYEQQGWWPQSTLGSALEQWARQYGSKTAVEDARQSLSYVALETRSRDLASGLLQLGITRGNCVLVQMPNMVEFALVSWALFRLGALPIMVLPAQRESDIAALCELAQPVAYIVKDRFLGYDYQQLALRVQTVQPCIKHVLTTNEEAAHCDLLKLERSGREQPQTLPVVQHRDIALLLLSGGTTGTPKLIPRTHADYLYNAQASASLCQLDEQSVYLAALPVAHNFPLACPGIIGVLAMGGRVIFAATPGPDECFDWIQRRGVTFTSLVPQLLRVWMEARTWDSTDLSNLQFLQVGGARCEDELAAQVSPVLGCLLQQVFGMAEGLLCYTRLDDPLEVVIHTQGRPLSAGDQIKVVNADGAPVSEGEVGELLVRGPYTIRGYFRAAAHNQQAFDAQGYYRSGDLVKLRADGNLIVQGRIKEQINRAGEKISTLEVEEILCRHPAIEGAALAGLPDELLGERSCAFVICRQELSLLELRRFMKQQGLAQYKIPDQLELLRQFPLTAIGKVDKKRLVQSLQSR